MPGNPYTVPPSLSEKWRPARSRRVHLLASMVVVVLFILAVSIVLFSLDASFESGGIQLDIGETVSTGPSGDPVIYYSIIEIDTFGIVLAASVLLACLLVVVNVAIAMVGLADTTRATTQGNASQTNLV